MTTGGRGDVLRVAYNDTVFVGFQYQDDQKQTQWMTRQVAFFADGFFTVMDRDYTEEAKGRFVGESVYYRVIDSMADTTDKRDAVEIKVASLGVEKTLQLMETFPHSGVFKGMSQLVYSADGTNGLTEPGDIPVQYGATVTATYDSGAAAEAISHSIEVYKGSDGEVLPFTKRFKDPQMAVQTRLSIAEAYFELAKKHRKLNQKDVAEQEIAEGKRLLEEVLKDFPDTQLKAQADYLLANLVLELAEETADEKAKMKYYTTAVVQFANIVALNRTSDYAPKAQFKKALALELMGEIDKASDEYVKLSYRWPDNELVPETIARLGQYFYLKGQKLVGESNAAGVDEIESELLTKKSKAEFKTAADVYASLSARFPSHKLAHKTAVLASQCYMRADMVDKAAPMFMVIIDNPNVDQVLKSEAMYWCGDCYMRAGDRKSAYKMFKRLDWDFPASKWAKFARGRMLEEDLVEFDVVKDEN